MRLLPRSLRGRVTLVFTVGAAAVLSLCLALLYVALDNQLTSALDEDLSSRSSDISAALRAGDTGVVARDPMAQLYASDGTLLAGSPSLGEGRLLSAADVRDLRREVAETRSLSLGDEADRSKVRILPRRLGSGEVLVVGVSAEPLQAARERLVAVLLVAAPLLIGLLGLAGWLVVGAALRPVDILTREAAAISSVETDRRLPAVPGNDEIARLARTLDGMLGRLRVAFERERAFVDDASHELRTPIGSARC
jgi:two-component system OmpR family sensor kinase